jgi:hypothetical protein
VPSKASSGKATNPGGRCAGTGSGSRGTAMSLVQQLGPTAAQGNVTPSRCVEDMDDCGREAGVPALMGRVANGLAVLAVLFAACTSNGNGGANNEKPGRGATFQDRRDVPLPSSTNPDGSGPHPRSWHQMWRTTPGTPEHRCIDVGPRRDVRAGDFIAGNFSSFIRNWDGTLETSKLYYIPAAPIEGEAAGTRRRAPRRRRATNDHVHVRGHGVVDEWHPLLRNGNGTAGAWALAPDGDSGRELRLL